MSMWKKLLLDTLFPQFCLGCGQEGDLICKDCLALIEISEYQYCPFCKLPKRVLSKGRCKNHQQRNLKGLFAATSYKDALVKKLITHFKYKPYLKALAHPLASLIVAHFLLSEKQVIFQAIKNSLFIPIPLSGSRERNRGFNQATLIAKELSDFFGVPLSNNCLIKIKKTQPQVELKMEGREENIKGVFAINPENAQTIQGKQIFLVDDVFTTGATMEECARILKRGGADQIWGVVVAREG